MADPDGGCLPEVKQRRIVARPTSDGRVVARQLAQRFGTSEDTIRSDLRKLSAVGLCRRVYRGALLLSPVAESRR